MKLSVVIARPVLAVGLGVPFGVLFAVLFGACVPREKWDDLVALEHQEMAAANNDRMACAESFSKDGTLISSLSVALGDSMARVEHLQAEKSGVETERHNLQAALDESTAIGEQLRRELSRLGKDVNKILSDKGTLSAALDNAKARLEELRKLEESSAAETALFHSFEQSLAPLAAASQIRISADQRTGHPVLLLDGDLLFDDGKSDIRPAGKGAVMEVARLLADTKGRRFFVTVFSDEVVAKGKKVTSWELSAARSVTLVRYLVSLHVSPDDLTAGGAISTEASQKKEKASSDKWHRRVEVAVLPATDGGH